MTELKENISEKIIYNNQQLLAFNKIHGLPCQPDKSKDPSLLDLAQHYCKHPLHVVHRIDRPVSGVVLFAKNSRAMGNIQKQIQLGECKRIYLGIVPKGILKEDTGGFSDYLVKDARLNKSFVTNKENANAKLSELKYKLIASLDFYNLYEISLNTGRHHQIRCQFSNANAPLKGDNKYGAKRKNQDRSIGLHAWKMSFKHPVSKEVVNLEAPIPTNDIWSKFQFDQ